MIDRSKKVSVIIPFFNGVKWLEEAVESVLSQTYDNFEIIVVNDGSKEDISDFLSKYSQHIIYHYQNNSGVSVARNYGMKIASGEYIAFLDSDDIWLPQKLEIQIAFMEVISAKWSHTGFYYWYPEADKLKIIDNHNDFGDVRRKFYVTMKVATPSVIISKQILEEHPEMNFPPDFKKGQDTQFYRAIANYYPIALIEKPLLKVRMRNDNSYKQAYSRFKTNAMAYDHFRRDKRVPGIAKCIMAYYKIGYILLGENKSSLKEKIAQAMWIFPYFIERAYSKYLTAIYKPDSKYKLCD